MNPNNTTPGPNSSGAIDPAFTIKFDLSDMRSNPFAAPGVCGTCYEPTLCRVPGELNSCCPRCMGNRVSEQALTIQQKLQEIRDITADKVFFSDALEAIRAISGAVDNQPTVHAVKVLAGEKAGLTERVDRQKKTIIELHQERDEALRRIETQKNFIKDQQGVIIKTQERERSLVEEKEGLIALVDRQTKNITELRQELELVRSQVDTKTDRIRQLEQRLERGIATYFNDQIAQKDAKLVEYSDLITEIKKTLNIPNGVTPIEGVRNVEGILRNRMGMINSQGATISNQHETIRDLDAKVKELERKNGNRSRTIDEQQSRHNEIRSLIKAAPSEFAVDKVREMVQALDGMNVQECWRCKERKHCVSGVHHHCAECLAWRLTTSVTSMEGIQEQYDQLVKKAKINQNKLREIWVMLGSDDRHIGAVERVKELLGGWNKLRVENEELRGKLARVEGELRTSWIQQGSLETRLNQVTRSIWG